MTITQSKNPSSIRRRLGAGAVGIALAMSLGAGVAEAQGLSPAERDQVLDGTHEKVRATATTIIDGETRTHDLVFVVEKDTRLLLVVAGDEVAKGPVTLPIPPPASGNGFAGGASAGATSVDLGR